MSSLECATCMDISTCCQKRVFKCCKTQKNIAPIAGMPHQANAPDFARQSAKSGTKFQIVIAQQRGPDQGLINTCGHPHRIQLRQTERLIDKHRQTHRFEPGDQGLVMMQVPRPGILQSFLLEDYQRLVKAIQGVDGGSVVIAAPRA